MHRLLTVQSDYKNVPLSSRIPAALFLLTRIVIIPAADICMCESRWEGAYVMGRGSGASGPR